MTIHLALVNGRMRESIPEHLTSERLAAFLDRRLTGADRELAVRHFASCAQCREELVELRAMLDSGRNPRTRRWFMVAGAAAAIIAFVLVPRVASDRSVETARVRAESGTRLPNGTQVIEVVSPSDRGVVVRQGLELFWRPVAARATYLVAIQDTSGNEVWRVLSGDTSVVVPDTARLNSGHRYFWSVDARLADGGMAKTGVRSFIVR